MNNSFSTRIMELRKSLSMNQTDFAKSIGTTQAALSGYEKGERMPSYEILLCISNTHNVSIDWLFGLSDIKSNLETITTYPDLFRLFIKILETRYFEFDNVPIIDEIDSDKSSVVLTLHEDPNIQQFFTEWCRVFELHCNNTIDDELYHLWIEKELAKFKNHPINGVPF